MAQTKVTLNHAGIGELLHSAGVRAHLTQLAGRVEAAAKASAPVATGEYRESIHVEQDTTDRAVVRVVSDSPHALIVEANTGNLSRALGSAR